MDIQWNQETKKHFDQIIVNLPQFHRSIAEQLVKESAQNLAKERGSQIVEENDLVVAFFKEVPPAFKDMMKRLFNQQGIDYSKYIDS